MTRLAFVLDDLAGTVALAAGSCDGEESLLEADLPVTVAGGTGRRTRAFFSAAAVALRTGLVPGYLDLCRHSKCSIFESEVEVVSKIGTALHARAAASCTEQIAETKEITKNVAEISKHVRVEPAKAARCRAGDTGMPEPIVLCTFLRIAQNRIRFRRFLELFFRLMVSRIAIWMELECEFAIGALDFLIGSLA